MTRAERTFTTRCSLAVRPIDLWTGAAPRSSQIQVSLNGIGRKPIRTSDGCYAFLDVPGPSCVLVIASSVYLAYSKVIELDGELRQPPVLTVGLLPGSIYPPPSAGTGLIFQVCDERGIPLPGAQVTAFVDEESAVRGRLAEEKEAGEGETIRISPGNGKLLPGDAFLVRGRENAVSDWGTVRELPAENSVLSLEEPLSRKWSRGARLLPAVKTASDRQGTVVVPFRGHMPTV